MIRKNEFNKSGHKDGYWVEYNMNGDISSRGNYLDGKQVGYWEHFVYQGRTILFKMSCVQGCEKIKIEECAPITV